NRLVTPEDLRNRLLSKLDANIFLGRGRDKTMDETAYLRAFSSANADNKIERRNFGWF
ncbi:MAG: hypothetical protein JNN15_11815, partial [Blastocatellia bacterium]|nr:hypothetical protein [Blastocatellia bacterium]